jgi:ParB family transcriptional regulator, chromosome partitioning protein
MISTALLAEHPGNVREDLDLDEEFLQSVKELGILTSLLITLDDQGRYRVIEGHRRLAAAIMFDVSELPYDLEDRAQDEAGQYLDMYTLNHHRKPLTVLEEASALFNASVHGASRTRIRKATGLGKDQVAAALAAGKISGTVRGTAASFGDSITLDQLALLAEFEDDDEAVARLTSDFRLGRSGKHTAEQIRLERAEAAEQGQLAERLRADGYAVTEVLPASARRLDTLYHGGDDLTAEAHRNCPGRGAYFVAHRPLDPVHYCADPQANGHASRYQSTPLPDLTAGAGSAPVTTRDGAGDSSGPDDGAEARAQRKLVIDGNKAWAAARNVRGEWLAGNLLARGTAPKEAMAFITSQLLTMPGALRDAIARAPGSQLFRQLTGGAYKPESIGAWKPGRLPLAQLAVIVTAYEDRMDGDEGRKTWRIDQRFTQCDRAEAGTYFRFLASIGYELAPIEQAVADGVPWCSEVQPD